MIQINPNELVIKIEHEDPKAALEMLQKALIKSMQDSFTDRKEDHGIDPELQQAYYILLEILEATLYEKPK